MTLRLVIVALVTAVCGAVAGCGDDLPKPDLALAREVRAGSPAACVRTSTWVESHLRRAMWDSRTPDAERADRGEVTVAVDRPTLTGVTPGEAVFCDVRVTIGEGDGAVTSAQSYQIALGDDFGPDFARFRFTASGIVPEYAAARAALTGETLEWAADPLPCSRETPGAVPLKAATGEQASYAAGALIGRARQDEVVLPAWVEDRVRSARTLGEARFFEDTSRYGAVCGPLGCDRQAFGFTVQDRRWNADVGHWSAGIPTGLLRTRSDATAPYVYQAFGHTRSLYETCAFVALSEVAEFGG